VIRFFLLLSLKSISIYRYVQLLVQVESFVVGVNFIEPSRHGWLLLPWFWSTGRGLPRTVSWCSMRGCMQPAHTTPGPTQQRQAHSMPGCTTTPHAAGARAT
jgi:hypothetical protein